MDQRQEKGGRRLSFHQWVRIFVLAAFVTLFAVLAAAEAGPEPVDFFCNSIAAARGAVDPETRTALIAARECGHFIADYGFQAYGEFRFVEEIAGTDRTIWLVDFHNTIKVYTVR